MTIAVYGNRPFAKEILVRLGSPQVVRRDQPIQAGQTVIVHIHG